MTIPSHSEVAGVHYLEDGIGGRMPVSQGTVDLLVTSSQLEDP